MLKSFSRWLSEQIELSEKQKRSALGIKPPLYGVGQYPPLAQTPHSATAALSLTTIHKKTIDDIMNKGQGKKKSHKKHKRKD